MAFSCWQGLLPLPQATVALFDVPFFGQRLEGEADLCEADF